MLPSILAFVSSIRDSNGTILETAKIRALVANVGTAQLLREKVL
jgi:hypothetical protein